MQEFPERPGVITDADELQPGLQVVIIKGGTYYHERVEICSVPYLSEPYPIPNHDEPGGGVVEVQAWKVQGRSLGAAVGTEISHAGQGASNIVREYFLSTMGFCPDVHGRSSGNYTVRASEYIPDSHY